MCVEGRLVHIYTYGHDCVSNKERSFRFTLSSLQVKELIINKDPNLLDSFLDVST